MGKFSEKFLNAFSIKDDEDDYEDEEYDDYADDYDEYEADEDKGSFFNKKKTFSESPIRTFNKGRQSKSNQQEVCVFKPSSIDDAKEITETLLNGKAVVVNFEGLHVEIAQRIIDFMSGSTYALDGNLQKISNYIFIATPNSVDISGDLLFSDETSNNSYDIAGFKSPLL